jgi:ATP-dependent Zn protease
MHGNEGEHVEVDERTIAFHEAGHAVAEALLLNSPLRVTIEARPGSLGGAGLVVWSNIDPTGRQLSQEDLRHHLMAYFAGPWAAAYHASRGLLKQRARHVRRDVGNRPDYNDARALLRRYFPKLRITTVEAETRAFIRTHWHLIEAVAHALIERKTLTAKQLSSLLNELGSGK